MKTVNRGMLLRRAREGRLVLVESYHYDEMNGSSRKQGQSTPVRLADGLDWTQHEQGYVYLHASDFQTKSGAAWTNTDDTVTLIVHSNCNYILRVLEKGASK